MQPNTNETQVISSEKLIAQNIRPPQIIHEVLDSENLKTELQNLKKELKSVKKSQKAAKKVYLDKKTEGIGKLQLFKLKLDLEAQKNKRLSIAERINSLEKSLA